MSASVSVGYKLWPMGVESGSKSAEMEYLARTGGSAWEREKPFSPAGEDTFDESVALLHDFAVAAKLLRVSPEDFVIDPLSRIVNPDPSS